tara:strand:- start:6403 stop:6792 length:390 start_codon:yes stop_codon:yes gene_type:complete
MGNIRSLTPLRGVVENLQSRLTQLENRVKRLEVLESVNNNLPPYQPFAGEVSGLSLSERKTKIKPGLPNKNKIMSKRKQNKQQNNQENRLAELEKQIVRLQSLLNNKQTRVKQKTPRRLQSPPRNLRRR